MATNFNIELGNSQDNFDIDLNDQVENFVVEFGEITWVVGNDFNKLENRPSYNGQLMTGETNIPAVPTATSQLTNDANFQNANDVSNAISTHNQSSSAHQDIRQSITDEETARINADNGLQGQIDAITSASDVVDIVGTYAELQSYDTQHLKDNDVVKVLQDETHNEAMTYWRWSTSTHTWAYIGAEGPYYTKSEANTLLDEKLDADEVPEGFFDGPATIYPTEGTSVEIEGGLKLKAINLKGDTTQQTYSGKNLINANGDFNYGSTNHRTTVNGDGTITVTSKIGMARSSGQKIEGLLPNTTYTLSAVALSYEGDLPTGDDGAQMEIIDSSSGSNVRIADTRFGTIGSLPTKGVLTFTTPEDVSAIWASFNGRTTIPSTQAPFPAVVIGDLQLELGSTDTDYEPYVGGVPSPNPDYPQDVNVVTGEQTLKTIGKNLWGGFANSYSRTNAGVGFTTNTDGSITASGKSNQAEARSITNTLAQSNNMYITLPQGFYVISADFTDGVNVDVVTVAGSTRLARAGGDTASFSLAGSTDVFVRLGVPNGTSIDRTIHIQIEAGSTTTNYEPYQSQSYIVDLGVLELCKIGSHQDYLYKNGNDWYVHKATNKLVLDGSETTWFGWNYSSAYITVLDAINPSTRTTGIVMSDRFIEGASTTQGNQWANFPNGTVAIRQFTDQPKIGFKTDQATDLDSFKTWLSTHNTTVYYVLATPTDTQITDTTLIGQLNNVLKATLYQPISTISSSGDLPAIIKVEAYTKHLNSLLEIAGQEEDTLFVGTDGVSAGSAGLVPAPTIGDQDKYLKSDGTWSEVSGGGGSITPVQTTGTSTTDVMSQNAVSSMVFADAGTDTKIKIGSGASVSAQNYNMAIGYNASANGLSAVAIGYGTAARANATAIGAQAKAGTATAHNSTVAIGYNAQAKAAGAIAIGRDSSATSQGEINIGSSNTSYGYSSSNYRLITGVYDGQNAHDAVTVGQINNTIDAINTALGTSIPHIGASS